MLFVGLLSGGCQQKKAAEETENEPGSGSPVDPCEDLTGVSENDIALREKLAYVKVSPIDDNKCKNCNV